MDELLLRFDSMHHVRKLGEGTFGEAFGTGAAVFKIIPIEGEHEVNGAPQKTAQEILAEAAITHALSNLRDGGTLLLPLCIHAAAFCEHTGNTRDASCPPFPQPTEFK